MLFLACAIACSINAEPLNDRSGLGVLTVNYCIRVPKPAAKMTVGNITDSHTFVRSVLKVRTSPRLKSRNLLTLMLDGRTLMCAEQRWRIWFSLD